MPIALRLTNNDYHSIKPGEDPMRNDIREGKDLIDKVGEYITEEDGSEDMIMEDVSEAEEKKKGKAVSMASCSQIFN